MQNYRRGLSVEEILSEFPHLTPAQVHDALSYYYDNRESIDREIAELMDVEQESIMTVKQRAPLFERLRDGLEEGIAHVRGEMTLKTVVVPEKPPEIDRKTLAALRGREGPGFCREGGGM